jgi:diguanylate cyclase
MASAAFRAPGRSVKSYLKAARPAAETPWVTSFRIQHSVGRWLASPIDTQRARFQTALLALALYVVFDGVLLIELLLGLIGMRDAAFLAAGSLAVGLFFVAVIRSGANQRVRADPALLQAQCCCAVVVTSASYAVQGPLRGAVLSIVVLILVFGMFALSAAQAVRVGVISLALLGGVMLWKSQTDPARYPPSVEFLHFLLGLAVLFSISLLSVRLARMRDRAQQQNTALADALEQIRRLATRDDLTGLVNRRHMSELLAAEKTRHDRTGQSISLVLIDIDLFKRVNDEHGHAAGDTVLRMFAEVTSACLRGNDVLARWGGEEFLLMLPGTEARPAQLCVERIRTQLAQVTFDTIQPGLRITFSAGLSVLGADETVQALLERADQAMYQAKRSGRNCTVAG